MSNQPGNNVTKSSAYNIEGGGRKGRPRVFSSNAAKQAAYRERKHPAKIEPGSRVIHRTYGKGIVITGRPDSFIVAFQTPEGRTWRDLPGTDLTFAGRASRLPKWTDASKPLSRNYKPPRLWKTAIPATELRFAEDGEIIAVTTYAIKRAGRRKTRRDYSRLINHNLAVMVRRAMKETK